MYVPERGTAREA